MRYRSNEQGFTLIEFTITILIVGILVSVAFPLYQANLHKAQIAEAEQTLTTLRTLLGIYNVKNGKYPRAERPVSIDQLQLDFGEQEFLNQYFSLNQYTYQSDEQKFLIRIQGTGDNQGVKRQIDEKGELSGF